MKKTVSFLGIFLLALLLAGCSEMATSMQYQVYYVSTSGTKLIEESYTPENVGFSQRGDGRASGKDGASPGGKRPCESTAG